MHLLKSNPLIKKKEILENGPMKKWTYLGGITTETDSKSYDTGL